MKLCVTALSAALVCCLAISASAQPVTRGTKRVLDTTSWNVENVTPNNLNDNLDAICSAIVNNPSEVTFLQEILRDPELVATTIVERLQNKYSINETWTAVWTNVGREGTRVEYGIAIIRSTPTVKVSVTDFGILDRANMYSQPQDLVFKSAMGAADTQVRIRDGGPTVVGNRVPFIVKFKVERPGINDEAVTLANWHAPGPQAKNASDLFALFAPRLQREGVAVVTADFNYEAGPGARWTVDRPGGTTRGGNNFDGAVLLNPRGFTLDDITPAQGYDTRKGLFDHRSVRVRVSAINE